VQNSSGSGQANITVSLAPGNTQSTDSNGCVLFVGLDPGTYTASLNQSGYVGIDGNQSNSVTVGVIAATVQRAALNYDLRSALAVTLTSPSGYAIPGSLPITLSNSLFTGGQQTFPDCSSLSTAPVGCVSGTNPRQAASIFPGNSTYPYSAWAGSCSDAKPASGGSTTVVTAGATGAVSVALAPVNVRVRQTNGQPVFQTIYARHASTTGCQSGYLITLATSASDVSVALPLGTWTFTTQPTGAGVSTTLSSTTSAPTITVPAGT